MVASAAALSEQHLRAPSSGGTSVAVHELAGTDGPDHDRVLIAHATGFHARAYLPVATGLTPRFHTFGFDARGHGDTAAPPGWAVEWTGYGDDALAAAEEVAAGPQSEQTKQGERLIGFGHSMGGALLLMAAHRAPRLFGLLVLFEPIVYPPVDPAAEPPPPGPLPAGARRRRRTFPSIEEAVAHYGSRPPLDAFDPEALDAYVRYGFTPDDEGVRLKCEPQHEAATFEQGRIHRTWDLLADIQTPVVVASGRIEDASPAEIAEAIAERLPLGRYVAMPELDHFGPFTHPALVADLVATSVHELDELDDHGSP